MTLTRVAALNISALFFFIPALVQAQAVSSTRRVGGGGGVEQVPAGYTEAVQKRQEEDAKIEEFNRKRNLEEIDQYNREYGDGQSAPNPRSVAKANAGELQAEKRRAQQVAKQIEAARKSGKKGPSVEFLATQERFNDSSKAANTASVAQQLTSANARQTQDRGAAVNPKAMTAEQRELLRLELAECQRSGRTPDQLTQIEIAALKAKAGILK